MKVRRILSSQETNDTTFELLDDVGQPIEIVSRFMRHLRARDYSPNTLSAYCFDLLHFMTFLKEHQLTYEQFTPAHAWSLLEYLRELPSHIQAQRLIKDARQPVSPRPRSIVPWPLSRPSTNTSSSQICFKVERIRFRKSMTLLSHGFLSAIAPLWAVPRVNAPSAEQSG